MARTFLAGFGKRTYPMHVLSVRGLEPRWLKSPLGTFGHNRELYGSAKHTTDFRLCDVACLRTEWTGVARRRTRTRGAAV